MDRPGAKARLVEDLADDLMLAQELRLDPRRPRRAPRGDIGDTLGRRGRGIFLVGAGCSYSAEIPLAAKIAERGVQILAERYLGGDRGSSTAKADLSDLISAGKVPEKFKRSDGDGDWQALYPYLFSAHMKHPNHQRELIGSMVGQKGRLNWAHACLGELVSRKYVHTVLTTNFDQLVLEGIIRTGIIPVVADGLESLARIDPNPSTPQVVHLHGSMHTYDLRNSPQAVTETKNSETLNATMMSLLRQSTVLVIIGYGGGEEGIMDLIQSATANFPRIVIYWVAHEDDYRNLSHRAKSLIGSGENTFFIIDQDADKFFQMLMRVLRIGQPGWVQDPLRSLLRQSKELRSIPGDDEIGDLVNEYRQRIKYANSNREDKDNQIINALNARLRGDYDAAIGFLSAPAKDGDFRARRLLGQSYRDKFFASEGEDTAAIKRAIEEFRSLLAATDDSHRFANVCSFIDATFDLHDKVATSPLAAEDVARLTDLLTIIEAEKSSGGSLTQKQLAHLSLHAARGLQELAEKAPEGTGDPKALSDVVAAYRTAWKILRREAGERSREAAEGLAGAIVADAEFDLKSNVTLDATAKTLIRQRLGEAIKMQSEVVEYRWFNSLSRDWAGSLSNLASGYILLADFGDGSAEQAEGSALRDAERTLEQAIAAHAEAGNEEAASKESSRLAEVVRRLSN